MTRALSFLLFVLLVSFARAQELATANPDTTINLEQIIVEAYQYGRPRNQIPVAIGYVDSKDFERFNNSSMLPAVNTIAGVRMEERSPGSYRFSIRGSTLRSPFGVRNVKVYWNNLPFTDPGGNTYLNLLDFSSTGAAEIIKGPGGSLYGAGTGGVLLLNSPKAPFNKTGVEFSTLAGGYGLFRNTLKVQQGTDKVNTILQYAHQQADGYREQTKMARDIMQYQGRFQISQNRILEATLLYSDLYYQTPGGLTEAQFRADPSQARPATQFTAGAVEQKTAIFNKTFYGGFSQNFQWNDKWSNETGVYGSFTRFENPFITNYEKRVEQSWGGRSNTQFKFRKGNLNFGGEFQQGFSPINVYDNNGGVSGDLQNSDELLTKGALLFSQVEFILPSNFMLTMGASLNYYSVNYSRLSDNPPYQKERSFSSIFSPRIALLKIFNKQSVYGSVSQGFSPPTAAELFPSTSVFDDQLNPERGINFELGTKGSLLNNKLEFDIALYSFHLDETIVVRRTDDGDDYFINAGKTNQQGLEFTFAYKSKLESDQFISDFKIWTTETLNHYRFVDYIKDTDDLSGNKLTGTPPIVIVAGIDIVSRIGLYAHLTYTYTGEIPLDDGNTVTANSYSLLNTRIGYQSNSNKLFSFNFFMGVDNALNEVYSLGNDLNAFGGRYFNAAAPRSYYVGLKANINWK